MKTTAQKLEALVTVRSGWVTTESKPFATGQTWVLLSGSQATFTAS
jgi:hypothetical protein